MNLIFLSAFFPTGLFISVNQYSNSQTHLKTDQLISNINNQEFPTRGAAEDE